MDKLNTSLVFSIDVFRLGYLFAEVAGADSSRSRKVFSREELSAPSPRRAQTTGLTCSPQTIQCSKSQYKLVKVSGWVKLFPGSFS